MIYSKLKRGRVWVQRQQIQTQSTKRMDTYSVVRRDVEGRGDNGRGKDGDGTGKQRTDTVKKNMGLAATGHRHKEDRHLCEYDDSYSFNFRFDFFQLAHILHHTSLFLSAPTVSRSHGISANTVPGASRTHGRGTTSANRCFWLLYARNHPRPEQQLEPEHHRLRHQGHSIDVPQLLRP